MSTHTIQLNSTQGSLNVMLRGDTITLGGVQYRISAQDFMRLSIWTDNNVEAIKRKPYKLSDDDQVAIHEYVGG